MNPHTQSHKHLILNQGSSILGTGNQKPGKIPLQQILVSSKCVYVIKSRGNTPAISSPL